MENCILLNCILLNFFYYLLRKMCSIFILTKSLQFFVCCFTNLFKLWFTITFDKCFMCSCMVTYVICSRKSTMTQKDGKIFPNLFAHFILKSFSENTNAYWIFTFKDEMFIDVYHEYSIMLEFIYKLQRHKEISFNLINKMCWRSWRRRKFCWKKLPTFN